jgi:phosphoglycolate phosphatase-like HAD superfamily hydrolase
MRIKQKLVIFWDFDGVIKDSVDVKTRAFETLFLPYGAGVAAQVRVHHETNGGVSRFDKIPLYLHWAGLSVSDERFCAFCDEFSGLVLEGVVDSPWVPGVRDYLFQQFRQQHFVLITATPQKEMEHILDRIGIAHCFREVYGAPKGKSDAIAGVLRRLEIEPAKALVIGDSEADLMAARANTVPFLLRRTAINQHLQASYDGPQFNDLTS